MFHERGRTGAFRRSAALASVLTLASCAGVERRDAFADNRDSTGTSAALFESNMVVAKAMKAFEKNETFKVPAGQEPMRVSVRYDPALYRGADAINGANFLRVLSSALEDRLSAASLGNDYVVIKGDDGKFDFAESSQERAKTLKEKFSISLVADTQRVGVGVESEREDQFANALDRKTTGLKLATDRLVTIAATDLGLTTNKRQTNGIQIKVTVVDTSNNRLVDSVNVETVLTTGDADFRKAP